MLQLMTTDNDYEPTIPELEQLARSLAMDGSLGRHDAQRAANALRELAQIRRTTLRSD